MFQSIPGVRLSIVSYSLERSHHGLNCRFQGVFWPMVRSLTVWDAGILNSVNCIILHQYESVHLFESTSLSFLTLQELKQSLPKFPEKDFFGRFSSNVVETRRVFFAQVVLPSLIPGHAHSQMMPLVASSPNLRTSEKLLRFIDPRISDTRTSVYFLPPSPPLPPLVLS